MMTATLTYRGTTFKTVRVTGANVQSDAQILHMALLAAGEDKSSIFGYVVTRREDNPDIADVSLNTD